MKHPALFVLAFALPTASLSLPAAPALAQSDTSSTQNAPFVLHAETRLVVLDVVVTDSTGKLVQDLTKDDFTILEDKRPQTIRNFESIQDHAMPPNAQGKLLVHSSADLKSIGPAPVTVLVLDEMNTQYADMSSGRFALLNFLRHQPKILAQPTTLIASSMTRFSVICDYTQDRDALLAALQKHKPSYPSHLMRSRISGAGERMAATLASVQEIAKAQAGTPGRKNLIWIGEGFPSLNGALLDQYQIDNIDAALRQITNTMLRSRITLFVADPAGLQTTQPGGSVAGINSASGEQLEAWSSLDPSNTQFGGPFSFASLAPATGGRSYTHRNDVDAEIQSGITQGSHYYTLAYAPESADPMSTKFRKIHVEVRRPGLTVLTRSGYFPTDGPAPASQKPKALATAAKAETRDVHKELLNAAASPMTYNGIDVHVTEAKDGAYSLDVLSADLNWAPLPSGLVHTSVSLFAIAFTSKGKPCANAGLDTAGDAARSPTPGSKTRTLLRLPFTVPPTATRIRFVVRDATTGKIGTADLTLSQ